MDNIRVDTSTRYWRVLLSEFFAPSEMNFVVANMQSPNSGVFFTICTKNGKPWNSIATPNHDAQIYVKKTETVLECYTKFTKLGDIGYKKEDGALFLLFVVLSNNNCRFKAWKIGKKTTNQQVQKPTSTETKPILHYNIQLQMINNKILEIQKEKIVLLHEKEQLVNLQQIYLNKIKLYETQLQIKTDENQPEKKLCLFLDWRNKYGNMHNRQISLSIPPERRVFKKNSVLNFNFFKPSIRCNTCEHFRAEISRDKNFVTYFLDSKSWCKGDYIAPNVMFFTPQTSWEFNLMVVHYFENSELGSAYFFWEWDSECETESMPISRESGGSNGSSDSESRGGNDSRWNGGGGAGGAGGGSGGEGGIIVNTGGFCGTGGTNTFSSILPNTLPLHAACFSGKLQKVKKLIEQDNVVTHVDQNGQTAVFFAIWGNSVEILQYLIEKAPGIQVLEDRNSVSPLEVACLIGNQKMVNVIGTFAPNNIPTKLAKSISIEISRQCSSVLDKQLHKIANKEEIIQELVKIKEIQHALLASYRSEADADEYAQAQDELDSEPIPSSLATNQNSSIPPKPDTTAPTPHDFEFFSCTYPLLISNYKKGLEKLKQCKHPHGLAVLCHEALFDERNFFCDRLAQWCPWIFKQMTREGMYESFTKGIVFLYGIGAKAPDYVNALRQFMLAAQYGNVVAHYILGNFYELEWEVPKDINLAVEYYKKAASQNYAPALHKYSDFLLNGTGVQNDPRKSLKYLKRALKHEYSESQYNMGSRLSWGTEPLEENKENAFEMYLSAAQQDHVGAIHAVAYCLEYGDGVQQNLVEAARYYKLSAKKGNISSQLALGKFYENGLTGKIDPAKAVKYYKKAADADDPEAQILLGICFTKGFGVNKDTVIASELFQRAAENQDALIQHKLGTLFLEGVEVEKDTNKAVSFFEKAANLGAESSQIVLGELYSEGSMVNKDLSKAIHFYSMAASQENPDSHTIQKLEYLQKLVL